VRVLVPEFWYNPHFGEDGSRFRGKDDRSGRFEVRTVPTTSHEDHTRYRIKGLRKQLQEFQPDVIFCIHEEGLAIHRQVILCRDAFCRSAKVLYFSMHAFPRVADLENYRPRKLAKKLYFSLNWKLTRRRTQGALVHCPAIEEQMRLDGYRQPILVQTQVGVDPALFRSDAVAKAALRQKLGFDGFVIGLAGRLIPEKGVLDLLKAVEGLTCDWNLLFVGDGSECAHILEWARDHGWSKRVIVTGYVKQQEVAVYMNAMDCFVLGTHTNAGTRYRDMFPLVVAQAMTMGLPVVGANGGGIPYQLGGLGLLFEEDDRIALSRHLQELSQSPERCREIGNTLRERAVNQFCVDSMNEEFLEFIEAKILG